MPQRYDGAEAQPLMVGPDDSALANGQDLARSSSWRDLLGDLATPRTVCTLIGASRRELEGARRRGDVLAIRPSNRRWLYPLRQLRPTEGRRMEVLAGLPEVLRALYVSGDSAGAARWLATPNRRLEGSSPWETLTAGDRSSQVVEAARAQAAAWAAR